MSKASGYSLWLVPDASSEEYRTLSECIADIAKERQTPVFVPHATLLGGVDGIEEEMHARTQELAEKLAPYEIRLGEVGSNGTYFQILFSKIKQTEEVMRANAVAQEAFDVDKGVYFPHFSFAYGDLSPEQVALLKQQLAKLNPLREMKFIVREVELWRSEGEVTDWYKVATFPFKS